MTIDTLLETLDDEEPPPKSNLTLYQYQFAEHGFHTVNDPFTVHFSAHNCI